MQSLGQLLQDKIIKDNYKRNMKKIGQDTDKTNMDRASLTTSSYSSFYTLLHSKM